MLSSTASSHPTVSVRLTGWILLFAVFFGLQPALPAYAPASGEHVCIAVADWDGLAHWSEQWNGTMQGEGPTDSMENEGDEEENHPHSLDPFTGAFQTRCPKSAYGLRVTAPSCGTELEVGIQKVPLFIAYRKLIL